MSSEGIVGQILDGKYSIEKQLGKGGMGTVYLSTHIGTGRHVAVKVIAPDFMKRAEFVERFRREAKAAGRLRHPNVVDVTDFGFANTDEGEDVAYLVMEYLDGCTLGEVLDEEKKLPVEFTIDILEQVCYAVEEAHKQGIIHRDLKPDNIWLEPNQRGGYTVKVLDFGIAKLEEAQLGEFSELAEIPYEGGQSTKAIQEKQTIADDGQSETIMDKRNSTIVSENETMALVEESKTLVSEVSESKTVIQPIEPKSSGEVSLEDGTAILPANETQAIEAEKLDEKGTRLISTDEAEDAKGTKVIAENADTDKPSLKSPSTTNLTKVGAVLGTPLYMSPEQCRGKKLTRRSDIYSLAVIAYQMLSGKLPFTGDYVKVMNGHKNQEPPELKAKKVPKRLKGIVMQSLSKDKDDRPESADAFANKLRANSEGIGALLRRAIVIYSQRLPKFLLLAFLAFMPAVILTFARVGFGFLRSFGVLGEGRLIDLGGAIIGIITFFVQVVMSALLVGMTTWVVAQTIAFPLRPISLRATFNKAKTRWKSLAFATTITTLLSVIGFAFCILPGIWLSSRFMLVAPSIMMEDIKGRVAFRRSVKLYKRSFWTVITAALLIYLVPGILAGLIGFSIGSIVKNVEMRNEIKQMKKEGVEPMTEKELKKESVSFSVNQKGIVTEKKKDETGKVTVTNRFTQALIEGIIEIIWTPLAILITSFTSVVIALIYFKTRQAGGESMQELLGKLDDADQPQSKWQQRVRERLIQSGKITGSTTTNPSKS